jgi:hypothetical protein
MRIFPLTARFAVSHDKSFVVIEALILVPLITILVSAACRHMELGDLISSSSGWLVAMILIRQYGNYLNRWVPRRGSSGGVSSAAGDNGDTHVLEAMSGPVDTGADAERGTSPRQDQ